MRIVKASLVGLAFVVFAAPAASARPSSPSLEGRHSLLRAGMYASVVNDDSLIPPPPPQARRVETGGIQVLDRLCPKPGHGPACEPVIASLRKAIDDELSVPVHWVSSEPRRGGTFWAFAPVVRRGDRASFKYRWDDPGRGGCNGGGEEAFRRIDWTGWVDAGGYGFVGCSGTTTPTVSGRAGSV